MVPALLMICAGIAFSVLVLVGGRHLVPPQVHRYLPTVAYDVAAPSGKALVQGQPTTVTLHVSRPLLALLIVCIPTAVVMLAVNSAMQRMVMKELQELEEELQRTRTQDLPLSTPVRNLRSGAVLTADLGQREANSKVFETPFQGPDLETVDWMNNALSKMWQLYRPSWEATMAVSLQSTFDDIKLPPVVRRIELEALTLSNRPLWMRSIRPIATRSNTNLQFTAKVRYSGLSRFKLNVVLNVLGRPKIPIWISEVDLDANMRFSYHLQAAEGAEPGPFISQMEWSFTELPNFSVQITPLNVNLNTLPLLEDWLRQLITVTVPSESLYPKTKMVPMTKRLTGEELVAKERVQAATVAWMARPPHPELVGPHALEAKVNPPVLSAMTHAHRKQYAGVLKVILLMAQDMPAGTRDLFCTLAVGAHGLASKRDKATSTTIAHGAVWRQYFEFPMYEPRGDDPLVIRVFDHQDSGKNILIGKAVLDLSEVQDGVREDLYVPLQAPSKLHPNKFRTALLVKNSRSAKGKPRGNGTVRVRIVYKKYASAP